MANVVLAKHLDRSPRAVQMQALELLRTRRLFTRTAVQAAPKAFLVAAVLAADDSGQLARLTPHLNDLFFLAHWHDPADGFSLRDAAERDGRGRGEEEGEEQEEEEDDDDDDEMASADSAVRRVRRGSADPVISEADVAGLARAGQLVLVDVDVLRYQMNIVSFLRMHRAVAGGISPLATRDFERLMKSLAPLHRLDYVTPSLVALAAKKVYLHRIHIVAPEKERSMQWGSELAAIRSLLTGVGPEDVLDDVLAMVGVPV